MERLGIPAAAIGVEKLMNWAGRGMAKVQGFPEFPLAILQGKGMLEGMVEGAVRSQLEAMQLQLQLKVAAQQHPSQRRLAHLRRILELHMMQDRRRDLLGLAARKF